MHARYKREHGSDGAHRKSTTRGEVTTAEPVPKIRQSGWKRRPVSGAQQLGCSGGKFKTTPCVPKIFWLVVRCSELPPRRPISVSWLSSCLAQFLSCSVL